VLSIKIKEVRNINRSIIKYSLYFSLLTILLVFNSNRVLANETLLPKGFIDVPLNGANVKGEMTVSGWFLDPSGVAKIEILVDGQKMGDAQYGLPRSDVFSAYPAYQNSSSGYTFTLDTRSLTSGQHTITVKGTGNNGTVTTLDSVGVNVLNAPVRGYSESPSNGSTVKGDAVVGGWFLDPSGVAKIEILVDGQSIGLAQYGISRPDVANAFPEYQNSTSGYKYILNTRNLTNGQHTITVRGTGNSGAITTLDSTKINVQNPPVRGYGESPSNGSTVKGDTVVGGWFLDPSGVAKIEIFVDGQSVGTAQYGLSRTDVAKAYPEYENANSGFKYTLNTRSLTNGQHTITVKETGNNGGTTTLSGKTINVQNPPAKGFIDFPTNGLTVKGDTIVSGWFLDMSGVAKIEVLVDGKSFGTAQYGLPRTDVAKVYPDYQNPNSGYKFPLSTKSLTNGQHTITVRETGNNGSTSSESVTVNVQNPPAKGFIDGPKNQAILKGDTTVSGWYLDYSGVAKVEVLVDGKSFGTAQYGLPRTDVAKAYPDYQNSNSGYSYTLNTKSLTNGLHTITVKETGNNGATSSESVTVNVQNPLPKGFIDGPTNGSILKGDAVISGWYLDLSGVAKVEILVDGKSFGTANYGNPRLDVAKAYPDYQISNSGYNYTLNTRSLTNGQHTITVKETGNNGATSSESVTVNVQNPTPKGFIDNPINNSTVKGETVVSGWFLDMSGVAKIDVFIDSTFMGTASYGGARPDVLNAYPDYQNGSSGFQLKVSTLQFADGKHTLTVKETGNNGSTTTLSSTLYIYNGNPYLYVDLRKPSNITATDIVNFFNARRPDSPLKNYAQSFIDAQNKYGVNAQYLVAHAIWETGWGGSNLTTYKNNLYGYSAYDPCPFTCGFYFPSGGDSINYAAYVVRRDYLLSTGSYYNGSNLVGMNVRYATDTNWSNGIANLMSLMKAYDGAYYAQTSVHAGSSVAAPSFGRDIPASKPYPTDVIINYPMGKTATVMTNGLSFRSIPYTLPSTLITTLSTGTTVTVLGYNTDIAYYPGNSSKYPYDNRWYRVVLANGQAGWLYGGGIVFNN
jgi:beta-N-acetylglucosaminidase